jgi:hypothetical protein
LPDEQHDFKFRFLGLTSLIDPVRLTVTDSGPFRMTHGINARAYCFS